MKTGRTEAGGGRNLMLVVEYDGTGFVGWERQNNGPSIQEALEAAVFQITRERVAIDGSGRTDAGVHAAGQVASLRLMRQIHLDKLRTGVNAVLPRGIAVRSVREVSTGFHARKSALSKRYRYTVLNSRVRRPLLRFGTLHVPQVLDVARMGEAARHFVGTHDFRAFAKEAQLRPSCVRTILDSRIRAEPPLLHYEVQGTGFLYNMVRIITGTLIEVGRGWRAPESIPHLLKGRPREEAGWTVPPEGLTLVEVRYSEEALKPPPGPDEETG
jgi:tRNA pseudouridine38-40 synthase